MSADLGEGGARDDELVSLVDTANVCCGVHAGSPSLAIETALRCQAQEVEVVAHPGYDDRDHFGRTEVGASPEEIERLIAYQVAALATVVRIYFIKPHGALYHRCQTDREAAAALLRAAERFSAGVVGQPGLAIVDCARQRGITFRREAFADRAYNADGTLAPRSQPGAVLGPLAAAEQAQRLAQDGHFETICIHSDTREAVQVARVVRERLRDLRTTVGP